ncbi:hypothetical protein AABB24_038514 [Solanum stoloniferum]|uniref:Uncharacterized protein n=1 Tax=Solanum stoloniferum TaxID=62892 RepID=A0ABD2QXZ1_9SOLN
MIHACIFDFRICYFEELFFMFHGKQQRSNLCPKFGDEVPIAPMNKKGTPPFSASFISCVSYFPFMNFLGFSFDRKFFQTLTGHASFRLYLLGFCLIQCSVC